MIDAFARAPAHCHIVFMGFGPDEALVRSAAEKYPNVHFHPAVKPSEVHRYVSGADVGIYVLQNNCLNNYFISPNKVFDYLNAGLGLIVSDFPDIATEVRAVNGGWCIEPTTAALATLLHEITPDGLIAARNGAAGWARNAGWESQLSHLAALYGDVGFGSGRNPRRPSETNNQSVSLTL